jgi:phenylpropionate dioxygenase-like ring-hydroxylating dioxygenase large terminal subunit
VFGSLAADGPSLEDFLGQATSFDDMVDRAPDGELEATGGTFKHAYKGNWKLYLETCATRRTAVHPRVLDRRGEAKRAFRRHG